MDLFVPGLDGPWEYLVARAKVYCGLAKKKKQGI